MRVWGRRVLPNALPAPLSATLESGPLGLSVRQCRAAGSASGLTAGPFVPHSASLGPAAATRVLSTPAAGFCPSSTPAAGLCPSYRSG